MNENRIYHTNIQQAQRNGWRKVYMGNHGRIYGQKPGNHRIHRCYVTDLRADKAKAEEPK